jgi:hypothetical protein
MPSKIPSICLALTGLLILGACSKAEKTANKVDPTPVTTATVASPTPETHSGEHGKPHAGGTTLEISGIHLEMVPEKEADKTHLDLYVQKGENHEPIPTAKVVAQIQTPDGKQQTIKMTYAADEKHYTGIVPGKTAGQYQVKITTDISGKKVDSRFTFDR